jgi:hypothetical protein
MTLLKVVVRKTGCSIQATVHYPIGLVFSYHYI